MPRQFGELSFSRIHFPNPTTIGWMDWPQTAVLCDSLTLKQNTNAETQITRTFAHVAPNAAGIPSKSRFSAGSEAMSPSGCHAHAVKRWGSTSLAHVQSGGFGQAAERGTL